MNKRLSRAKILQDDPRKTSMSSPSNESALVEVYELKIKDLMEKLEKAKEKNKLLQSENEQLSKAQAKSVSEKQDIVEFLRIELTNHESTLSATETKLAALEQEKLQLLEYHTVELKQHVEDHVQEREQLQQKIFKLSQDLNELAEFRGRKEFMEKEVRAMALELEQKEKLFKTELTGLERKHLQDKHVLRKEMLTKVTDAVTTFRRAADLQMAETTKKAIKENLIVTAQLRKMAGKTTDLLIENELLKTNNTKLRLDKEMLEQMQTELITKNLSLEQLARKLIQKFNTQFEIQRGLTSTTNVKNVPSHTTSKIPTYSIQHPEGVSHSSTTTTTTTKSHWDVLKEENKEWTRLLTSISNLIQNSYEEQLPLSFSDHPKTFPYVRRLIQDLKSHRCKIKWCVPTLSTTSSSSVTSSSIEVSSKISLKKKSGNPFLQNYHHDEVNPNEVLTNEEVNRKMKQGEQQQIDLPQPNPLLPITHHDTVPFSSSSHSGPPFSSFLPKKKETSLKKAIRWDRSTTASPNANSSIYSTKVDPMKELLPYISILNK